MSSLSAGGRALGTKLPEVFIDVLMPAVTDLADDAWDYRFAALLTLQDQNVMGRGAVGFDLQDIDWGTTPRERARSKDFVLHAATLALRRHRWSELIGSCCLPAKGPRVSVLRVILMLRRRPGTAARGDRHG